jgi:phage baseplate assembly protein W
MGNFNFRNVGKTTEQLTNNANSVVTSPQIFGIKTPLRVGTKYIFEVTYSIKDQIADNLRNLILTNYGERLCLYNYGANLRPLLTEYVSLDDFDASATSRISSAVGLWMPYVALSSFVSSIDNTKSNGKINAIKLMIMYDVPSLKIKDAVLEVVLYVP